MIILIGGVGMTGKTLLAHQLMRRYQVSNLSVDHLKMSLFRGDPECGFTPTDDWVELSNKLWPYVKGIIMTCVENKQEIILEGYTILPEMLADLPTEYREMVIAVWLIFSEEYIRKHYRDEIITNFSAIEEREGEADDITVESLVEEHGQLKAMCKEHGGKYFKINKDYTAEIKEVYTYMDTEVEKLGAKRKKIQLAYTN